jgi:succinate dehydrogenase/fumarate reductase flavoprotein subunit
MNNATVVSGGGFRAAVDGLTPAEHLRDTVEVGKHLNDPELVRIFAEEGGERVLELRRFGVEIRVHPGGISVGDNPTLMGLGLTKPMVEYAKKIGVELIDNVAVTRLLKRDGCVVGAVGYDARCEEPVVFRSGAVVLATGGAGGIYRRTDCTVRTTGDGYSLGLRAGAKLRDMEFVQFFPMALAEPGLPPYLLGGSITEEGKITNALGEDIPKKYKLTARPLALKSRDLLSRAVMMEIIQGGGVDGAVLIDAREVFKRPSTEGISTTGPVEVLMEKLKASEKPFRVAPICHFCMGGLVIDTDGFTGVPGLYAAGEVVGGIHGANRHGGNALTDILVFGKRAGAAAARDAAKGRRRKVDDLAESELKRYEVIQNRPNGYDGYAIIESLKDAMWDKAGIIRDAPSLAEAFEEVVNLRHMAERVTAANGRDMLFALESGMALDSAELIIRGAMERKESRGAHYRSDYPKEDPSFLRPIIQSLNPNGSIRVE